MNRVAAIASAVSVLAFPDGSHAEASGMNARNIEHTLRTFDGTDFDVRRISHHADQHGVGMSPHFKGRSVEEVYRIQVAIAANRPLARRLRERGVSVRTIFNADQSGDGSITLYYL
ncbi:hypothetical protein ASC90_24155 [Rhizobium sp. Root1220]|nr:hypothetical protein ASC90_24155 [Rhizobium sp. Root1220]